MAFFVYRKPARASLRGTKQSLNYAIKRTNLFCVFCNVLFQKGGCVYIMTNKYHNVLYVGVTSDLIGRVWDHKNKTYPKSFTATYNCDTLVYYMFYSRIEEAIANEKALKGGSRKAKQNLVTSINPDWKNLYDDLIKE